MVDVARLYKAIGDAWYTYANTPEGKAHLANGGASFADLLRTAGFKVGSLVAQAKATAQQQIQTIEASNWQPAIEDELDALLEDIEAEEQLSELNQQEANQPTTIPAEESITGQPITIEPQQEEPIVNSQSSIVNPLLSLIASGKAKTQDFARFFRDNPSITEAQATELGIRPLTQRGNPTATYPQGRLIAAKLTPRQFEDYLNGKLKGKLKGKALKQALTPQPSASANFSIKAVQEMQNVHNCVQELSSGEDGTLRNTALGHDIIVPHGRIGKKGYGVNHMHEKRLLHGFTEDEAAFIIVCAMKAAATDTSPAKQENSLWFERYGIRAVVAQNSPDDARPLTGFIWNTKGGKESG